MDRPSTGSKKDPARRRKEVLAALREGLESACVQHMRALLMSRSGSSVVVEVVRRAAITGGASSWSFPSSAGISIPAPATCDVDTVIPLIPGIADT